MRRASYIAVLATIAASAMALAGASSATADSIGGGQDFAECEDVSGTGTAATLTGGTSSPICVIVQSGSSNTARCVERSTATGAAQSCDITQTGAENRAFVTQSVNQSGDDLSGTQTAKVTQGSATDGATVSNELHLNQDANQSSRKDGTQTQDVYQSADVKQFAADAGTNVSEIDQSQLQKAMGGSTQLQNTVGLSTADCDTGVPSAPNACATVVQESVDGTNANHLRQSINEDANTGVASATQMQGSSSGGLEGKVHQEVTGSGSSLNKVNQSKQQKLNGGASQTQYDPVRCCGTFSQDGGSGNTEEIDQSSMQDASVAEPFQQSELIGQSVSPEEGSSCMISQNSKNDADSSSASESQAPCLFLQVVSSCSNVEGEGGCDEPVVTTGEPDSSLTLGVRNESNEEVDYLSETSASEGDVIGYKVVYSNSGTGLAHSVTGSAPVPAGTGAPVDLVCPLTCSVIFTGGVPTSVTWGLGDVAPGTAEVFTTVTFTVVVTAFCGLITEPASVVTDEEGTVTASPVTVDLGPCLE